MIKYAILSANLIKKIGGIKKMESIYKIVDSVNGLLWGKNILVFMLIGAAIYFSFKTKFMQFRLFHKIVKVLFKMKKVNMELAHWKHFS